MNPLTIDATDEQRAVLQEIWNVYLNDMQWPIYHYVELIADRKHGVSAEAVLASMPLVREPIQRLGSYGWIWIQDRSLFPPRLDTEIALTIAGMSRLDNKPHLLGWFLTALSTTVDAQRRIVPSPHTIVPSSIRSVELLNQISEAGYPLLSESSQELRNLLFKEPPFLGSLGNTASADWVLELRPALRRYRLVQSIEDYLDQIAVDFGVAEHQTPQTKSGLSLPEAIDYLDITWRVVTRSALFGQFGAVNAERLAQPCTTAEEFDARMNALYEALNHMKIPTDGVELSDDPKPVEQLKRWLISHLPDESSERVHRESRKLQDLVRIRAGGQHRQVAAEASRRWDRLGVTYPPQSYAAAWDAFQVVAIEALNAIRDEVRSHLIQ